MYYSIHSCVRDNWAIVPVFYFFLIPSSISLYLNGHVHYGLEFTSKLISHLRRWWPKLCGPGYFRARTFECFYKHTRTMYWYWFLRGLETRTKFHFRVLIACIAWGWQYGRCSVANENWRGAFCMWADGFWASCAIRLSRYIIDLCECRDVIAAWQWLSSFVRYCCAIVFLVLAA